LYTEKDFEPKPYIALCWSNRQISSQWKLV